MSSWSFSVGMGPTDMKVRGRISRCGVMALLQLGLALPAAAQFTPVQGREYREFYNPINPVRGEAVVGLSIVPTESVLRGKVVEVWLPDQFAGELHIETTTADGRFRGEGAFSGSSTGGRWVPLMLTPNAPGAKAPAVRPGDPGTLSLAVRGPGQTFYVARWGGPDAAASRLRLYVNSRRADMFVRAGVTVVRCVSLNIPQPLRFDVYCDVAVGDVPADGRLMLIRRDQFDEQTQTFTVNVRGIR